MQIVLIQIALEVLVLGMKSKRTLSAFINLYKIGYVYINSLFNLFS